MTALSDDELNAALDALRAAEEADMRDGVMSSSEHPDEDLEGPPAPPQPPARRKKKGPPPLFYRCTDLGNSERLVAQHGHDLRFSHGLGWLVWDGRRWRRDDNGECMRRAKLAVREIQNEAAVIEDEKVRKAVGAWAKKSESAGHIKALLSLAESDARVVVRASEIDANPFALNCENGTVDLRTGELRPHDPKDLITKICPVAFDRDAQAPTFLAFIASIFAGDAELVGFVQRFLGYSLTGDVREQTLFFAYGMGSNGKSTLFDLLLAALGDHAKTAAPSLLVAKRGESHPTERADLHGARLVTVVEVGAGKAFDEELVKQLTGGDVIKARYMNKDFFEFRPTHKLLISANHKPTITGTDHAIWRRIALVPFAVQFHGEAKDTSLPQKLLRELPGFLAWAVRGCLEWQAEGLRPPSSVIKATAAYRAEQDTVGMFLEDRCLSLTEVSTKAGAIYSEYTEWAKATGEYAISQRALGLALAERGFQAHRGNGGVRMWRGLGLKASGGRPSSDASDDSDAYQIGMRPSFI